MKALHRMLGHASAKETFDTDSDLFAADLDSVAAVLNQVTTKMNPAKMSANETGQDERVGCNA
ncbi:hypothetical protein [Cryobacterium sp. Hb1]|uniref:hypothetical protein n=1 Tax=Cryobacterium sp. Hb1 TaxID=1259147 RepID=UPI0018E083BC